MMAISKNAPDSVIYILLAHKPNLNLTTSNGETLLTRLFPPIKKNIGENKELALVFLRLGLRPQLLSKRETSHFSSEITIATFTDRIAILKLYSNPSHASKLKYLPKGLLREITEYL